MDLPHAVEEAAALGDSLPTTREAQVYVPSGPESSSREKKANVTARAHTDTATVDGALNQDLVKFEGAENCVPIAATNGATSMRGQKEQPMPALGEQPTPALGKQPTPAQEKQLMPAQEKQPTPAQEKRPTPTQEKWPTPAQEKRPTPTQEKRPTPAQEKRLTPTQEKQPTPAQEKQPTPAQEKQPTPAQEKQSMPASNTISYNHQSSSVSSDVRPDVNVQDLSDFSARNATQLKYYEDKNNQGCNLQSSSVSSDVRPDVNGQDLSDFSARNATQLKYYEDKNNQATGDANDGSAHSTSICATARATQEPHDENANHEAEEASIAIPLQNNNDQQEGDIIEFSIGGPLYGIQFYCDPDEMLVRVWCGVRLKIAVDRRSIQIMLMEWRWVFAYCAGGNLPSSSVCQISSGDGPGADDVNRQVPTNGATQEAGAIQAEGASIQNNSDQQEGDTSSNAR